MPSLSRFLLALGLTASTTVCAAGDAHEASPLAAGIAISVGRFDYREYDDAGRLLDRETANIPALSLSLGGPINDFFWLGEVSYQRGSARYVGQTSLNAPHNTTTRETIFDGSVQVGRWFTVSHLPPYAVYAGLGHRKWDRIIAATPTVGGLSETYRWWYGFLGAQAVIFKRKDSEWSADVRIVRPIDPSGTIDFQGAYSVTPELEPAARPGVRVAFPWRHKLNGGDTLSLEPYFEQWNLGRSENVSFRSGRVTLTVHQPESETRHSGVRLVWSRIF